MKTRLRLSVWLLLALATLFLGCVITQELTRDESGAATLTVYDGTLVLASLAVLAGLTVICCFGKQWLSLKGIGFLICHLSVVLFLGAAFAWFIGGTGGTVSLVSGESGTNRLTLSEGEQTAELPFSVTCTDFTVTYRLTVTYSYSTADGMNYKERGRASLNGTRENGVISFTTSSLSCGSYGRVPSEEFFNEDGSLKEQFLYENMLLTYEEEESEVSVKQYHATVTYSDGGSDTLSVNHPSVHNGWKLYLTSYGDTYTDESLVSHTAVTLQVKRDPANGWAVAGLILCPIGTFLLCLRPRRKREEEKA